MRKAQFFSLTGVLLLILLIVLIRSLTGAVEHQQDFQAERAQIRVLDNFARNFENLDVPQMIEVGSKIALVELSKTPGPISAPALQNAMENGIGATWKGTDVPMQQIEQAYPGASIEGISFSYTLQEVSQPSWNEIKMTFWYTYEIQANNAVWKVTDKEHVVTTSIYGITHPNPNDSIFNQVITEDWVQTTPPPATVTTCLADELFANSVSITGPCTAPRNAMPLPAPTT